MNSDIYKSELWVSDLDRVLKTLLEIDKLVGNRVLITGAAGLICSAVVDLLIRFNETNQGKIVILVAGRWIEEMKHRFGHYMEKPYFKFVQYDASLSGNQLSEPCDYIIHGASNAYPEMIVKEPVETMISNFWGIKELLDYSREMKVKRLLYISSSEVYGLKNNEDPFDENDYGYIDLLKPRNSYSISKRATETLCVSYGEEYGTEAVIVRPGHIYGPTASPKDNRVSSAWMYAAVNRENIVLKSDGSQMRSYCYCLDCASAIIKVLLDGEDKHAYNISNPESIISIKQLAEYIADSSDVQLRMETPSTDEKRGFNPMKNSSLRSDKLQSLGWRGIFGPVEGISHTVSILNDIKKAKESNKD